jgi:hypothetical protein
MTKRELRALQTEIDSLVQYECYSVLNMMLYKLCHRLQDLGQEKMLAYVRMTAPHRRQLSIWKPFIMSIHDELSRRGLDADVILDDYL